MDDIREMSGESKDIVTDNIQKLKELFPEVVTEDKIDFEQLKEVLGNYTEDKEERYKFEWHGKAQALRLSQTPSTGTLRPCKEDSKNWEDTENLYIEGDNLEVLKLLQKTYHNRIKMIYIDPPYNTGNDFVYPDNYKDNLHNYLEITGQVDSEGNRISTNSDAGGQFHTKWLNMMYPRLRLARNLLSDDGVIFISIDDNEVHNLRKVCDEVFGEGSFLGHITWIKKTKPINSGDAKYQLQKKIEYVLAYCKKKNRADTYSFKLKEKKKRKYNKSGKYGNCRYKDILDSDSGMKNRDTMKFSILGIKPPKGQRWKIGKEEIEKLLDKDRVRVIDGRIKIEIYPEDEEGVVYEPFWSHLENVSSAEKGKKDLNQLFSQNIGFDTVKSIDLISELILHFKNGIKILDFFSGSATTAHAVMKLNAEDGGNRKYIMVQLPEPTDEKSEAYKAGYKTICEIGKERIRRAGDQIVTKLKEKQTGQKTLTDTEETVNPDELDIGFKVFKLDSSNLKKWNPDYDNLQNTLESMITNIVDGRSEEDLLYEIMLKFGIDLTYPIETEHVDDKNVYNIGNGALFICLDKNITKDVATFIASKKDEINPEVTRVVFRDNGFSSDADKTNIVHILKHAGIEEIMSV